MNPSSFPVDSSIDVYEEELKIFHRALRWNRQRAEEIVLLRDSILSSTTQLTSSFLSSVATENVGFAQVTNAGALYDEEEINFGGRRLAGGKLERRESATSYVEEVSPIKEGLRLAASPCYPRKSDSAIMPKKRVSFHSSSHAASLRSPSVRRRLSAEFEELLADSHRPLELADLRLPSQSYEYSDKAITESHKGEVEDFDYYNYLEHRKLTSSSLVTLRKCFVAWRTYTHLHLVDTAEDAKTVVRDNRGQQFWRARLLQQCLHGWHGIVVEKVEKAEVFHKRCLLQKSLECWAWSVCRGRLRNADAQRMAVSRLLSTTFNKWREQFDHERLTRLRELFCFWHRRALLRRRERLLRWCIYRKRIVHYWTCWKTASIPSEIEQASAMLAYHFNRRRLLQSCFRCWWKERQLHCGQQLALQHASVFYSKRLLFRMWHCFVVRFRQCGWADEQYRSMLLVRCFTCWLNRTLLSRYQRQQQESLALVFHRRVLVKNAFSLWRHHLHHRAALRHYVISLKRRTFAKWWQCWLQCTAIDQLHLSLACEHYHCSLVRRAVRVWRENMHRQRRHRVVVAVFHAHRQSATLSECFLFWKAAMSIHQQQNLAHSMWSEHCVRRAVLCWRHTVYRSRLHQLTEVIVSGQKKKQLRTFFQRWRRQFSQRKTVGQFRVKSATASACFAFKVWRERSLRERQAKDLHEKHRIAFAARCFQGWRFVTSSARCHAEQLQHYKLIHLRKIWERWRTVLLTRHSESYAVQVYKRNLLTTAWTKWQAFLGRCHTEAIVSKLCSLNAQRHCFSRWKEALRTSRKFNALREKSKRDDITRLYDTFTHWLNVTRSHRRHWQRLDEIAVLHSQLLSLHRCMVVWRRAALTLNLAKHMADVRCQRFLHQIIISWRGIVHVQEEEEICLFEACLEERDSHKRHQLLATSTSLIAPATNFIPSRQLILRVIARWQQPLCYRAWLSWQGFCEIQKLHRRQAVASAAFCDMRLKKSAFQQWKREAPQRRRARQFFLRWKQVVMMRVNIRACWEKILMRRYVHQWVAFVTRQKANQRRAVGFTQCNNDVLVRTCFLHWHHHFTVLSERQERLLQLENEWQQQHLGAFFRQWHHECQLLKVHRLQRGQSLKKCFWRWRLALAAKVPRSFSPRLMLRLDYMEKVRVWRVWRMQFVTQQAMKTLESRENEQLCQQVFLAWHKFAQVKKKPKSFRDKKLLKRAFMCWKGCSVMKSES